MRASFGLIALASLTAPAAAQATFTPVGGPLTGFRGAGPDGVWHVGGSQFVDEVRVWSTATGELVVPSQGNSSGLDISVDGTTIGGTWRKPDGKLEAGLLRGGVTTFLGGLGGPTGATVSTFLGMNDDASVVVGRGVGAGGKQRAFRWSVGVGMQDLGSLHADGSSSATAVSADGSVVVGSDSPPGEAARPVVWIGTTEVELSQDAGTAWGVSADGAVVIGHERGSLFRWTAASGLVVLGKLPGSLPVDQALGLAVSDDGDTIVGVCGEIFVGTPPRAFVWRPGAGVVDLEQVLVALGASVPANADLFCAYTVSADGRTISGVTHVGPPGLASDGFVATLPEVAQVYCTAKVNSAGCTPAIAYEGTPSASSGAGFTISADQILAQVAGVLIYSKTGPATTPFQGGILCVGGQITRTPGQLSGGTTGCSGALALDFNAFVASGFDPALVSGTTVWAQYWSRDPGFAPPNASNTTDALEFTLWP